MEEYNYLEERNDEVFVIDGRNSAHEMQLFRSIWVEEKTSAEISDQYGISETAVHEFKSYCTTGAYEELKEEFMQKRGIESLNQREGRDIDQEHNKEGPAGFIHEALEGRDYSVSTSTSGSFTIIPRSASGILKVKPGKERHVIERDYTISVERDEFPEILEEQFNDLILE